MVGSFPSIEQVLVLQSCFQSRQALLEQMRL